jgi:hypothetical protein
VPYYSGIESYLSNLEDTFPFVQPEAEFVAGTFDAATGQFTGFESEWDTNPSPPPPRMRIYPRVVVNAVDVSVTFNIVNNANQVVGFYVNGDSYEVAPGAPALTVSVGKGNQVTWSASSDATGGGTRPDTIYIVRPPVVGVGVFTLPAAPVLLVYEPPLGAGAGGVGRAAYSASRSVGTVVSATIETSTTTEQATRPARLPVLNELPDDLKRLADILDVVPNSANQEDEAAGGAKSGLKYVQMAADALRTASGYLRGLVGNVTASQQITTEEVSQTSMESRITFSEQIATGDPGGGNRGGPGVGDIVKYLVNPRYVWLNDNGSVRLYFLGCDGFVDRPIRDLVSDLKSVTDDLQPIDPTTVLLRNDRGPITGLTAPVLRAMLALDPFVGSNPAGLDLDSALADRFTQVAGSPRETSQRLTVSVTKDMIRISATAQSDYAVQVTSYKKGMLSMFGIGPSETKTVTTRFKMTSYQATATGTQEIASVDIGPSPAGIAYGIYYDSIFGTIAVREQAAARPIGIVGHVHDHGGRKVAGAVVTAIHNGRKVTAISDANGRFEFKPEMFGRSGEVLLDAGGLPVRVDLGHRGSQGEITLVTGGGHRRAGAGSY